MKVLIWVRIRDILLLVKIINYRNFG